MKRPAYLFLALLALSCHRTESSVTSNEAPFPGNAEHGKQLVAQYACNVCHIVPGTGGAQGTIGPSLVGVVSRPFISHGTVQNTPDNLKQFIKNPEALNPQSAMPATGLPDADAQDVLAFLQTLH